MGFFSWKVSSRESCDFLGDIGAFFPQSGDFGAGIDGPLFLNKFSKLI